MNKEEAIKILKDFHDKSALFSVRTALETLHPELKESEDEKIRKSLIILLQHFCKGYRVPGLEFPVSYKDMLAWLEKQGEHKKFRDSIQVGDEVTRNSDGVIVNLSQLKRVAKPAQQKLPIEKLPEEMKTIGESLGFTTQKECDEYNKMVSNLIMSDNKVKPKFHEGEWVVFNDKHESVYQIEKIENFQYTLRHILGGSIPLSFSGEDMIRPWTIQDAKDGDVLAESKGDVILMFRGIGNERWDDVIDYHFYYDCYRENFIVQEDVNYWGNTKNNQLKPATKEQRDTLFAKMKEAGYEWDAEKKELKKIELTDVGHEYYSELLKNDKSDNIADYAYQCVYCMSHDWTIENPTWDNVQSACRLGAKWQKKHNVSEEWSEEDERIIKRIDSLLYFQCKIHGSEFENIHVWLKSLKDRYFWKPKEWEIQILESVIEKGENPKNYSATLHSILEQLKKLKGE